MIKNIEGYKEETCFDNPFCISDDISYADHELDHVLDTHYYRRHFVGTPHSIYVGNLESTGPVIISVKREEGKSSSDFSYRVICRMKDVG